MVVISISFINLQIHYRVRKLLKHFNLMLFLYLDPMVTIPVAILLLS